MGIAMVVMVMVITVMVIHMVIAVVVIAVTVILGVRDQDSSARMQNKPVSAKTFVFRSLQDLPPLPLHHPLVGNWICTPEFLFTLC